MGLFTSSTTYLSNNKIPPRKLNSISTESSGSLKAIYLDEAKNILYAACHDDGRIYAYNLGNNLRGDINPTKIFSIPGPINPRAMVYLEPNNQLAIGYKTGIIAVYNLDGDVSAVCRLIRFKENPQRGNHADEFLAQQKPPYNSIQG